MKKSAVWLGGIILGISLYAPVPAEEPGWVKEFRASSLLQVWTIWEPNYNFGIRNAANPMGPTGARNVIGTEGFKNYQFGTEYVTRRQIYSRLNFVLEWGSSEYVHAVLQFEANSAMWGEDPPGSPSYARFGAGPPFGTDGGGSGQADASHMAVYKTDQVALEIKWAYLDFTIPNTPINIAAGLQNFNFGGRLWMLNDAPGIKATFNYAPHNLTAFWWREEDKSNAAYWTNDTYGLEYSLSQKNWMVAGLLAYKNDQTNNIVPGAALAFSDQPWWAGIRGSWRPGNWNLYANFVYNFGKRDYLNNTSTLPDADYRGWAVEGLVQYRIGPGLSVAAEGLYTTGIDNQKNDKYQLYTYPTGSEWNSIFGADRTVIFWQAFGSWGSRAAINFNYAGFAYARANLNYSPRTWLNFGFNYIYFWDTSSGVPGRPVANAQAPYVNTPLTGLLSAVRQDEDHSSVGQEINLFTKIRIYSNLMWQIGLATFIPGVVFDSSSAKASNIYAVNSGMQLAF